MDEALPVCDVETTLSSFDDNSTTHGLEEHAKRSSKAAIEEDENVRAAELTQDMSDDDDDELFHDLPEQAGHRGSHPHHGHTTTSSSAPERHLGSDDGSYFDAIAGGLHGHDHAPMDISDDEDEGGEENSTALQDDLLNSVMSQLDTPEAATIDATTEVEPTILGTEAEPKTSTDGELTMLVTKVEPPSATEVEPTPARVVEDDMLLAALAEARETTAAAAVVVEEADHDELHEPTSVAELLDELDFTDEASSSPVALAVLERAQDLQAVEQELLASDASVGEAEAVNALSEASVVEAETATSVAAVEDDLLTNKAAATTSSLEVDHEMESTDTTPTAASGFDQVRLDEATPNDATDPDDQSSMPPIQKDVSRPSSESETNMNTPSSPVSDEEPLELQLDDKEPAPADVVEVTTPRTPDAVDEDTTPRVVEDSPVAAASDSLDDPVAMAAQYQEAVAVETDGISSNPFDEPASPPVTAPIVPPNNPFDAPDSRTGDDTDVDLPPHAPDDDDVSPTKDDDDNDNSDAAWEHLSMLPRQDEQVGSDAIQGGSDSSVMDSVILVDSADVVQTKDAGVTPPPAPITQSVDAAQHPETMTDPYSDESDSDDEDANPPEIPPPLGLSKPTHDDSDDDLEVNAELAASIQGTVVAPPLTTIPPSNNPLAEALGAAIAEATLQQPPPSSNSTYAFDDDDDDGASTPAHHSAPAKSFGIAYQKQQKPARSASTTAASYDIGTIDMDMAALPIHSAKDIDDSDEFEDVLAVDTTVIKQVDVAKLQQAVLEKEAAKQAALVLQMQEATRAERQEIAREREALVQRGDGGSSDGGSSSNGGKAVLTEIHDMYKRGLGDQEVVQQTSSSSDVATTASDAYKHAAIIEEGDEDDDADDDEETPEERADKLKRQKEEAEWANVEAFQQARRSTKGTTTSPKAEPFRWIRFQEALDHFEHADYVKSHLDAIVVEDDDAAPKGCMMCFRPPMLNYSAALAQRELVFCIALCPFQSAIPEQYRLLQTIYQKLTSTRGECPLSGSHWEVIGFQGNDPSTDLRGAGMLSLLQMLYAIDSYPEMMAKLFASSRHEHDHFPLACVLINMTLHVLVGLRGGALTVLCNKEKNVLGAMNQVYCAMVVKLLSEWQAKHGQVEFPFYLKPILDAGQATPMALVAEMAPALAFTRGSEPGLVAEDFTDLNA
ncbi:Aste57867_10448 [Aphanomyces stellatus]|uniref:Aste57867_10448 protein n=1 Tax=Aphanomyces stellatus TaxID=120398 RepID=A0A485KQD2_9STRA|nr:hypothetical protein As57867_010408 [Aphanomyces stellatus]VFT87322.1 Aste57867_10448 [Aphanomyces stellatus]